ncbi:glycosyltransferase [Erythrobacter arachoides]|uniref:Glycosyltransferase n=2 Tax=Aurantiacibacter arachoides TaxID=1850444 RepID=A0A845A056_9SPHN|nr:glycosyltransferase [Aurantiacibacter arachoides]
MVIGVVTWSYPPEKSGLAVAAREIAQSLAALGHDVRVLTLDRGGRGRDGAVEIVGAADGLSPLLRGLRKLAVVGHLAAPLAFARVARREHAIRPFDVIEGTNWYAPLAALARSAIPVVTRCSSPVAETVEQRATLRNRLDAAMARWLEAAGARASAGIISNSRAHGRKIAALYGVAAPSSPLHAVVGLSLSPAFLGSASVARFPDPLTGPVRVLFVGRPERRKGFDAVIEAIALLADAPVDFTLVGIAPADLGSVPLANVTCHHRLDQADLLSEFERAHVVLCPSRYESFGLVYQEAMAFGRVVLACKEDPSAREFVGEPGGGILAARCDGPAIAEVLRDLLEDRRTLSDWRERALATAGRFDRGSLGTETETFYRNCLQRAGMG